MTMRCHYTPTGTVKYKNLTIPIADEDGKQQGLILCWWKCKDIQIERQLTFFF